MPMLNMTVPHNLEQNEALTRIKKLLGDVKTQFADKISNLQEDWDGNTGKFQFSAVGLPVSGSLTVKPSTVEISIDLPAAAMLFRGAIESTIRERAAKLLA